MPFEDAEVGFVMWFCVFLLLRQRFLMLRRKRRLFLIREAFRARQRKRRMLLLFINGLIHERNVNMRKVRQKRRAWAWPRNQNWFQLLLADRSLDSRWPENFHITRQTFEFLCDLLRPDLQRQDTRMRKATSVEKKVLVSLWRLVTGESFQKCSQRFAIGKSTAKEACKTFEEALVARKDEFIKFPSTSEEIKDKVDSFEDLYGIPQIVGALYCHRIEIHTPSDKQTEYLDHKQRYSVTLLAIIDSNLKFIHATAGFPGSISDAEGLKLSEVYDKAESQQILASPMRELCGTEIRPLIVGGKEYPLTSWIVTPYLGEEETLTPEQNKFNTKLNGSLHVAKRALNLLKARFGIVVKKTEQKTDSLSTTLTAACVLHNICIDMGDIYCKTDISESNSDDNNDPDSEENTGITETGETTRNLLRDYVWENL